MNFVKTFRAKSKIKNALKDKKKENWTTRKRALLLRKLRHIRFNFNQDIENEMFKFFNLKNSLDMYYLFGVGKLNNKHIRSFVNTKNQGWYGLLKNKISKKDEKNFSPTQIVKRANKQPAILFGNDKQILDYKLYCCLIN